MFKTPIPINLTEIFSDDHIIIFEKPPGLIVTPSTTHHDISMSDILSDKYKIKLDRGGVVHRLDKDTSGLIIVARTQKALENLQYQFKDRQVKKQYLALVHGELTQGGKIVGAIERNPQNREKFVVSQTGKEATTEYTIVSNIKFKISNFQSLFEDLNKIQLKKLERNGYDSFTLLNCFPLTGRTHQIRVHLKYINHPVVADEKYGGRKITRLDKRWCPRQFLHACKIEFSHPVSGQKLSFESLLPQDLKTALGFLEPTYLKF